MLPAHKLNTLSQLLTPSTFRKIILEGEVSFFSKRLQKFKSDLSLTNGNTNREVIRKIYSLMNDNYRFEYLYKNILFDKLISERKLSETIVLNELRIGASIADTVFINGEAVLYEVKTELDNPQKLISQIRDYEKAFPKIFVVTHESIYYKYYQLIKNSKVGLIYLSSEGDLVKYKEAESNFELLDTTVLFKLLRKNEYSSVIKEVNGSVPNVPNTLFFKTCLEEVKKIETIDFYKMVCCELKKRNELAKLYIYSTQTPSELRYICYTLDFDKTNYQSLYKFLKSPFKA